MEPVIIHSFIDPQARMQVGKGADGKMYARPLAGLAGDIPWAQVIQVGTSIATSVLSKPVTTQVVQQAASVPAYPDYAAQTAQIAAQIQAQQQAQQQAQALAEAQAALKAAQQQAQQNNTAPSSGVSNQTLLIGGAAALGLVGLLFLQSQKNQPRYATHEPVRYR